MHICSLASLVLLSLAQSTLAVRVQPQENDADLVTQQAALERGEERYAKNLRAYTQQQFKDYYKTSWAAEWTMSPKKTAPLGTDAKKMAEDGKEYTMQQYADTYDKKGEDWRVYWNIDWTGERYARDGKLYDLQGFKRYYKQTWKEEWTLSPTVWEGSEKAIAKDGTRYSRTAFKSYYDSLHQDWRLHWKLAKEERRYASDGMLYTKDEFAKGWEAQWLTAQPEKRIAEDEVPYTMEDFLIYYQSKNPTDFAWKWIHAPVASPSR